VLILDLSLSQPRFERLRAKINRRMSLTQDVNRRVSLTQDDTVTLRRYLATFERLGFLLERDIITVPIADHFYGHRFRNLIKEAYPEVQQITEFTDGDGGRWSRKPWSKFITLWRRMQTETEGGGDLNAPAPLPPSANQRRWARWWRLARR
jgi:hypothetical protein